jgi:ubiquinone/menaquinone biosynthesis C-methylase UbiE
MVRELELEAERAFRQPQWYLTRHAYNIRLRAEIAQAFLKGSQPSSIIDIGCGNGSVSIPFLAPGGELTFFDRSETMLGVARSRVPREFVSQVKTIQGDFMTAPLEAGKYDLVVCLGVLPYVEDGDAFISKLSSLIKPGGGLITDCTNHDHILTRLRVLYGRCTSLLKPAVVWPIQRSARECVTKYQACGVNVAAAYKYCLPPPVIERLFSDDCHCRMIYGIFGRPGRNRNTWLGNEVLLYLRRAAMAK